MAAIDSSYAARQNAIVFTSVFPSRISPPSDPQRLTADASKAAEHAYEQVTEDARLVLGIGNERYTYNIQGCRYVYRTHFTKCPSMHQLA